MNTSLTDPIYLHRGDSIKKKDFNNLQEEQYNTIQYKKT